MKNHRLDELKQEYMSTPVPEELDFIVRKALQESGVTHMNQTENQKKHSYKKTKIAAASVAAAFAVMVVGANASPVFAATLSKVPVVGSVIKVLTFQEYSVDDDTFQANIKTPAIEGLDNKSLENSLNQKYLEENKKLYEQFQTDMEAQKKNGGGHLGVDSGYEVKTDTDQILSIGRYTVNTVASSSTTMKYDTIDKQNQILISLPSLFKDDKYIEAISENIKQQMVSQHKADPEQMYWVEGIQQEDGTELFENISRDQNFYINADHKLVISFDKYEVAPGYMGISEFVIPTEAIQNLLVGSDYIQ